MAPFPLPAHQTGRADFRHPAFRLASSQGTRHMTFNADAARQHPGHDSLRPTVQLPPMPPDLNGADRPYASHRSLASSKAHQKSGSFAPPALPGINARMTLSDSRKVCRAFHDIGVATSDQSGPPPITRTTFPTCRAHYPGGSNGCICRFLPRSCCLPQMTGGSASALSLSRPAQASIILRPVGSLSHPR